VLACANCRQGVLIDENGPAKIDVRYMALGEVTAEHTEWRLFWVFAGQVRLERRETQGGGRSGEQEARALWGEPRRLFVPAWELSMRAAQEYGSQLTAQQPALQPATPPEGFHLAPAVLTAADALAVADFIVLAIEARRKDWLKDLAFRLDVGAGQLWATPVV
jgi:hypothetical protein